MTGEQDFMASERQEIASLLQEAGQPQRGAPVMTQVPRSDQPHAPAPQQNPQPQNFQQPQAQPQAQPQQQEDLGLSQQVFTPPGMEQYAQEQTQQANPGAQQPNGQPVPGAQQPVGHGFSSPDQQQANQPGPPPGVLEERARRQQVENDLSQTRSQQQRLSDRLDMMNQIIAQTQQQRMQEAQTPNLPDPNDDLQGYVQALNEQYTNQIGNMEQRLQRQDEALQHRDQTDNVRTRAQMQASTYAAQHPDFPQAYQFLKSSRMRELEAQGFDPATVAGAVEAEEMNLFTAHLDQGRNVAEAMHKAAMARGWNPQGQQQPQPQPQQHQVGPYTQQLRNDHQQTMQQNYGYQAPVQQQYAQPAPGQQGFQQPLATMQAGMMNGAGLADASQAGAATPLSLEAYANMPDAQFAGHMDDVRRLLGG